MLEIKKILLVGSGNVATHLAINLKNKNYNIQQVFSRSIENAKDLAKKVNSDYTDNPKNIVASERSAPPISLTWPERSRSSPFASINPGFSAPSAP